MSIQYVDYIFLFAGTLKCMSHFLLRFWKESIWLGIDIGNPSEKLQAHEFEKRKSYNFKHFYFQTELKTLLNF